MFIYFMRQYKTELLNLVKFLADNVYCLIFSSSTITLPAVLSEAAEGFSDNRQN